MLSRTIARAFRTSILASVVVAQGSWAADPPEYEEQLQEHNLAVGVPIDDPSILDERATTANLCSNLQSQTKRTATFRDSAGTLRSFSVAVGGSDPWKGGPSTCLGRCGANCKSWIVGLPAGSNAYTQACLNHDVCYSYQDYWFGLTVGRGACDRQFLLQTKTDYKNSPDCYSNLLPFQPPGWSSKIVISKGPRTNKDSTSLSPTDNLYVDFAFVNLGAYRVPNSFRYTLTIRDNLTGLIKTYPYNPAGFMPSNWYYYLLDTNIGKRPKGSHTATLRVDAAGDVVESNEGDNVFSRTFVVGGTTQPNGLCYIDETCSLGSQYRARDSGNNQCVATSKCTELWKCAAGPTTRTCGSGTTCCNFSPGCPGDVQTCSPGFCTNLNSCRSRINF